MRYLRSILSLLFFGGLVLFTSALAPGAQANGATFNPGVPRTYTVNTLVDTNDGACNNPLGTGSGNKDCTLREAIEAANANAPTTDTIKFSLNGTITLGATLPAISDALFINGSGQSVTVSGNNAVRVMQVKSGKTLKLKNLTIANGKSADDGGGIYNDGGSLIVNNSIFRGNAASGGGGGGGIFSNGGTVNVTNSTFTGNSVTYDGGGIYPYNATLNVSNSTFSNNTVGRSGGGFHNAYGTVNVANSLFNDNVSDSGGGIYNAYGIVNIANSTFSHNGGIGGGLAGIPGGGGILNYQGVFSVSSSTFSGNYGESGFGTINNWGTLNINNSIITHTTDLGDCLNNATLDGSNNLVDDTACSGGGSGSLGRIGAVTGFDMTLRKNGGPTKTHAIFTWSNAIDAVTNCTYVSSGTNPLFSNGAAVATDQRGVTRPQGTHCDTGAFERQLAYLKVIKHVVNSPSGTAVASDWTIKVTAVNSGQSSFKGAESPGVTVILDPGAYKVTESGGPAGYQATFGAGCNGALAAGDAKTCKITNTQLPHSIGVSHDASTSAP